MSLRNWRTAASAMRWSKARVCAHGRARAPAPRVVGARAPHHPARAVAIQLTGGVASTPPSGNSCLASGRRLSRFALNSVGSESFCLLRGHMRTQIQTPAGNCSPPANRYYRRGRSTRASPARLNAVRKLPPVPLDMKGLNPALGPEGSYIVNAQGGCNDATVPSYAPGGDPFVGSRRL